MKINGFTDKPALEDRFAIEKYISGLSRFIKECNTPMTVSIQGDWGTGKTSIMSMVQEQLKQNRNIHLVWFNTWQFSQFNLGDRLSFLMLSKLINEVGNKKSEIRNNCKKILGTILNAGLTKATGGIVDGNAISSICEGDFIDKFEKLHDSFQRLIMEKSGKDGRVVIFVDDLDRLAPERAVELLEVLKILNVSISHIFSGTFELIYRQSCGVNRYIHKLDSVSWRGFCRNQAIR